MSQDIMLRYLQKATSEIFATVAAVDMMNEVKKRKALLHIDGILNQYKKTVQEVLPEDIIVKYFGGVDEANKMLGEAGVKLRHTKVLTDEGKISKPFQKAIHLEAVEELVQKSMGDMTAAIRTAQLSAGLAVEKALQGIRDDLVTGALKGDSRAMITNRVMKTFLKEGTTSFITSDGKSLPLDFYASTVVRTKNRDASVTGSRNRFIDAGQDLVMIVGNGDGCAYCAQFHGMVLSLEGKTEGFPLAEDFDLPPFHPNCDCGERPFVIDFKTSAEIAEAKARNAEYEPGVDRRTPEEKAMYEKQQELRRIANDEKKQFARWQATLGADAPKTLGSFRRMKHGNSLKFQELQSNYRSASAFKGART